MALHEQSVGRSDEWYTPAHVFEAMGARFDLDVAYPLRGEPEVPADRFICTNSLSADWRGFVWMNPPFGARNGIAPWLAKFMAHGNGVALTPDRTSAPWWHDYASHADSILFVRGKLKFISGDGRSNNNPAQGTCLMAKGERGVAALENAAAAGLGLILRDSRKDGASLQSLVSRQAGRGR